MGECPGLAGTPARWAARSFCRAATPPTRPQRLEPRERMSMSTARKNAWCVVGLCVLTAAAFYPFLFNGYTATDTLPLIYSTRINSVEDLVSVISLPIMSDAGFSAGFYRPVSLLSFSLDQAIWGELPFGYHLTDILLHLVCVLLVYSIARILAFDSAVAFVSAALFALHPLVMEVVPAIARRQDTLACLGMMLTFVFFLKWFSRGGLDHCSGQRPPLGVQGFSVGPAPPRLKPWTAARSGRNDDQGPRGRGYALLLLSSLCYFLSLASKEVNVLFPAVLAVYTVLFCGGDKDYKAKYVCLAKAMPAYALVLALYLAMRFVVIGGVGGYHNSFELWRLKYTILNYLPNLFYPQDFFAILPENRNDDPVLVLLNIICVSIILYIGYIAKKNGDLRVLVVLLSWLLSPLIILMVTGTSDLRSYYAAIVPFSLAIGYGSIQSVRLCAASRNDGGLRYYAAGVGSSLLSALSLSIIIYSPLFFSYSHWKLSAQIVAMTLDAVEDIVRAQGNNGIEVVDIYGIPSLRQASSKQIPHPRSVSYLNDYVIYSYLKKRGYTLDVGELSYDKVGEGFKIDRVDAARAGRTLTVRFLAKP